MHIGVQEVPSSKYLVALDIRRMHGAEVARVATTFDWFNPVGVFRARARSGHVHTPQSYHTLLLKNYY